MMIKLSLRFVLCVPASIYGFVDVVQILLDNQADVDDKDNDGYTSLMHGK